MTVVVKQFYVTPETKDYRGALFVLTEGGEMFSSSIPSQDAGDAPGLFRWLKVPLPTGDENYPGPAPFPHEAVGA